MKTWIVRAIISTRVIVPDDFTEDQVCEFAVPNIVRNADNGLCNDMECEEDLDCPFDEEEDTVDMEMLETYDEIKTKSK